MHTMITEMMVSMVISRGRLVVVGEDGEVRRGSCRVVVDVMRD